MITVRRASERAFEQRRTRASWLSFPYASGEAITQSFGPLELLEESRLSPHSTARRPCSPAEIITYVHRGTISYEDSAGRTGLLRAGDFQRMTVTEGVHYDEVNASPIDWAHVFQLYLKPPPVITIASGHEQRHFTVTERRDNLCMVASPHARSGALKLHHDAYLYSAILGPGRHTTHALRKGRMAWLQIVEGAVTMDALSLQAGDGVGVAAQPALSWTSQAYTEVLLFDLETVAPIDGLEKSPPSEGRLLGGSAPRLGGAEQALRRSPREGGGRDIGPPVATLVRSSGSYAT